ncbi:DoxX family protein [Haladaptatus cibarius]|uniref:DoxX family protein n=1 Tax=Haladaptatus cibarius TaxID=453847 RepID=UPI000679069F|nr:DoxX-like family protein [Haladaptatus cibarius]
MSDKIDSTFDRLMRPLLYVMSFVYVVTGVLHFVVPKVYARIIPPQFPRPVFLVYFSGLAEVVLGIGVLFQRTRRQSAWGLIALLVAVFPSNVYMARNEILPDGVPDWANGIARVALWVRLPFQGVLILWAWWYTRVGSGNGE